MVWWKRLPFFYGWVIVATAFVCYAVGYATWHSFSIFYVAILQEFGWSRGATAVAFSVFTIAYGLNAPIAGTLVDRFGPRTVLPLSAILLGIGLLLTTRLTSLWEFYLLFGIVSAIGLSGMGTVPTFTVLNSWFVKKRGTAAGFATAGIGVGTALLVPTLQIIITNYGWRTAYVVLAIAIMLIVPALAVTFQRHRPQDMGLLPDGEAPSAQPAMTRAERIHSDVLVVDKEWASREWTLGSALRTRRFWLAFWGRFLELACLQMFLTHQAAFFVDAGFDKLLVASVVGMVGIVGSSGKILWGIVSDRLGREVAYTLAYLFGTAGVGILLTIGASSSVWMLYAYGLVYGICYGASAVLLPVLSADMFHCKRYGSILGGLYVGGGFGSALGAFLGGYAFDLSGSYLWAFSLAIPGMWVSCLLFWLVAPRKVRLVAGRARSAVRSASPAWNKSAPWRRSNCCSWRPIGALVPRAPWNSFS